MSKLKLQEQGNNNFPPTLPSVATMTAKKGTQIKTEINDQLDAAKQEAKAKLERKLAYKMKAINAFNMDFPELKPTVNKLKDLELNKVLKLYVGFKKQTKAIELKPGELGYVQSMQAKQRLEQKLKVEINNIINPPAPKPSLPKKGRGIVKKYKLKNNNKLKP